MRAPVWLLAGVLVLAPAAAGAGAPVTATWTAPGEHRWVVPGGVRAVQVTAVGGRGGATPGPPAATGGAGVRITAVVPVVPGQVLWVEVGADGHPGDAPAPGPAEGGGAPGGGGGAYGAAGGGGGGASDVRTVPAGAPGSLGSRLVVAAGGGGAGGPGGGAAGGAGGGADLAGADGGIPGGGGGAGGRDAGGAAGLGGAAAAAGVLGAGGAGAAADAPGGAGGGGGGGWFGGGGGGSAADGPGGGGGGGSSHVAAGVTPIAVDAADGPPSVAIAYAPAPTTDIAPSGLVFSPLAPGRTSPPRTITVTNNGSAPLNVRAVTLEGDDAGDFVVASGCTAPQPPGAGCVVFVRFTPRAAGTRSATLAIDSDAPGAPVRLLLSGTGVGRPPQLSRLALSPGRFRPAGAGAALVPAGRGRATLVYRASGAAWTSFAFRRVLPGVRRGTRCVRPPVPAPRRPRRCSRLVTVATARVADEAGLNRRGLTGRARGRALAPGRYLLTAVPRFGGRAGAARTVAFTILPPRRRGG